MIKWLIVLIIALMSVWIIFKDFYPNILMETEIADSLNAIGYPIEKTLKGISPESDISIRLGERKDIVKEISGEQLLSLLQKIDKSNKYAVILFYNVDCITCRFVLRSLNRFAAEITKERSDIIFVLVAIEKDFEDFKTFMDYFGTPHFKPLVTKEKNMSIAESFYLKEVSPSKQEMPICFVRNGTNRNYENIPISFFTKSAVKKALGISIK